MSDLAELKTTIRRNKLLGMWAAEKLGLVGAQAEAYSNALAESALEAERSDVLGTIRKDFDAAGVALSDEQILAVMNDLMLEAGRQMREPRADASDAAKLALARRLASR